MSSELVPLPATAEAIAEFGPFSANDVDLLDELQNEAARVREVVPTCVGVSIGLLSLGVTFTLVATSEVIAALDAVQYVSDGPCIEGALSGSVIGFAPDDDPLSEASWQSFARATSSVSVTSTLTLPVLTDEVVVGSVNLYASTPDAFDDHHDELAAIFHAWAPGAVTNADVDFSTRSAAEQAPQVLQEEMRLQQAIGVLMVSERIDAESASRRIHDAALRAGVKVASVVATLINTGE